MNRGKHAMRRKTLRRQHIHMSKAAALLVAFVMIAGVVVGTTIAYLITKTDAVINTFTPGKVSCAVEEKFDGDKTEKSNVQIKNTGNTYAYIRATYVVNWLDKAGNVAGSVPDGYSYELIENPTSGSNWVKYGDYYYYTLPVAPDGSTEGSLLNCVVKYPTDTPEYTLSVKVIATAVQSEPAKAVNEAWGVSISQGSVSEYKPSSTTGN